MDWAMKRFMTIPMLPEDPESRPKFGKYLFCSGQTLREFFENRRPELVSICIGQSDNVYLESDVETLIRSMLDRFVGVNRIPRVRLDGSLPSQSTISEEYIGVQYTIPIDGDPDILLYKLPSEFECGLSEWASIDVGKAPKKEQDPTGSRNNVIVLTYAIPKEEWENGVKSSLNQVLQRDLTWFESVLEEFHAAFEDDARELTKLLHVQVLDKWRYAMDVAAAVAEAPLPVDFTDYEGNEDKEKGYRVHKKYLFGQQKGKCKGCGSSFHYDDLTVDHILSRKNGGGNELLNLQLLCQPCNNLKGCGTQEELLAKLQTKNG